MYMMYAIMCILNLMSIFIGYTLMTILEKKGDDDNDNSDSTT